jgi:transposase-like protein
METLPHNYQPKRGAHVPQDVKDYILKRIKESGKTVPEIAAEHGISKTTVYGWIADSGGGTTGEVTKLRKENASLKSLVAELSLLVHTSQKKSW